MQLVARFWNIWAVSDDTNDDKDVNELTVIEAVLHSDEFNKELLIDW